MHIGKKISEIINLRHSNRRKLGNAIGVSGSSVSYLSKRKSIDVDMLAQIGNALQYNFFRHYPVAEAESEELSENIEAVKMESKIEELTKDLDAYKRDLAIQQRENVYLKKINELLERRNK